MDVYTYNGPVKRFNDIVGNWKATTSASSEKKALNNLSFRYKKEHGLTSQARITLEPKYIRKENCCD